MKKRLFNRINNDELKERMQTDTTPRTTISFYQYYHLGNPTLFRHHIYQDWVDLGVYGRVYVSYEGVNAQISLPTENLEAFKEKLSEISFLEGIRLNTAIEDDGKSFYKLAIKVREKIVADGLDDDSFDVTDKGIHVNATEFNDLAEMPETVIIDMRNHYESEVGHFQDAFLPDAATFREALPEVVEKFEHNKADKNIVMYCTGGIRCEKASAYLKHQGFKNVFQLEGGIIEYTRQAKKKGLENKFRGKNFVFDERLGERISPEVISHCHQCGTLCDTHINCANDACHLLFIQCESCAKKFDACCSKKCQAFKQLPLEEQKEKRKHEVFNGTKFGKSRYKAHKGGLLH